MRLRSRGTVLAAPLVLALAAGPLVAPATKVVTAATVLKPAAEGSVDLDTPVQHYLPGLLTQAFKPISVRRLLNHTSGIKPGDGWGDDTRGGLGGGEGAGVPPR
ncbi:serine hydrolase domain-containing protein [Streptomyces diastatochromogenes]|uniref:serine hydrolase domain-containing protein n=1 Tax=Streptomyces diastatochromogenes TaxID=42236 RepID=UPI0036536A4D